MTVETKIPAKTITDAASFMQIDLLEEIANRLKWLQEWEESQRCEGEERGWEVEVTDSVQEVFARDPVSMKTVVAHTASIFNDGPDIVKICVNYPHQVGMLKLAKGDTQNIDYSRAKKKIISFWVWCNKGENAKIRIHIKY
jgi:hypothetical protein